MSILALIPARGGSKGLARKNLRLLAGKPLVAYPIISALEAQSITRTIVSTEDEEIASVAALWGAEVPFIRPAELAADDTPDLPVFQHALGWLREHEQYSPELVVHLRATTPLRDPTRIDAGVAAMRAHPEADSLRSVSKPPQTPYKMWRVVNGLLEPLLTLPDVIEPYNMPRQQLPAVFWGNGYLDIVRPHVIVQLNRMSGTRILPFVMEDECVDIDSEESLQWAESLLAKQGLRLSSK